jgi:putative phage-type endonuclease
VNAVTKDRHSYLGASETAAALNLGRFEKPPDVWLRKGDKAANLAPREANTAMRWGTILEAPIRVEAMRITGLDIGWPAPVAVHPELSILRAHPDGLTSDGRVFEAKTARTADGWGEQGSDEIPQEYLIQVQTQMACQKLPAALVAVLIGGSDFRLYEVPADKEIQEFIAVGVQSFWQFVTSNVCPPIDYTTPGALGFIKRLYPGTSGEVLQATPEMQRARWDLEQWKADAKAAQEKADARLAELLDYMKDAALLEFEDGKALRRQQVSRKEYLVKATSWMDARFVNTKGIK